MSSAQIATLCVVFTGYFASVAQCGVLASKGEVGPPRSTHATPRMALYPWVVMLRDGCKEATNDQTTPHTG